MNGTLVDSNVLLDVATGDPEWSEWSTAALARAADESRLVLNPIVYAEVSIAYERIEDLDEVLPPDLLEREHPPFAAAFLAGKAFLAYRRRGGTRTLPLPDFLIGAHAAVAGYRILTRDPRPYRTYYPTVPLLTPA